MKIIILTLMIIILSFSFIGCNQTKPIEGQENENEFSLEEQRRIDLYIKVMKAAYEEENGGDGYIAIHTNTLEGLSEKGIQEVMRQFKDITENVYDYITIENDETKIKKDEQGRDQCTINGSILGIQLTSYSNNKAVIEGISWFGNLGAVFPKYNAVYKNGEWQLKLISMAIS